MQAICLLLWLGLAGCSAPSAPGAWSSRTTQTDRLSFPFPHGIVVYVNPLNCKLGVVLMRLYLQHLIQNRVLDPYRPTFTSTGSTPAPVYMATVSRPASNATRSA